MFVVQKHIDTSFHPSLNRSNQQPVGSRLVSLHVWMPCHSAPYHSTFPLIHSINARFFDCSPAFTVNDHIESNNKPDIKTNDSSISRSINIYGAAGKNVCSESDLFNRFPSRFIQMYYTNWENASEKSIDQPANRSITLKRQSIEDDELLSKCQHFYQHRYRSINQTGNHRSPSQLIGGSPVSGLPDYVVLFDTHLDQLLDYLTINQFRLISRLFHSHLADEKYVYVYHRSVDLVDNQSDNETVMQTSSELRTEL